ncbi:aldo/keto reductase [Alkalihalobacillus oceani]|uniref:Aldo/keto reductase n=1 Tax=Halalkalibacter oceani TaxID=1653776 RepID=A0A9X2DMT2_9BACI|nr:aldo/keto reductase [Halalkalibacter oceani]MCM3713711.1 aldo/keto reductase [Halalkalibacter oceani]
MYWKEKARAVCDVAEEVDKTPVQVALNCRLQKEAITSPIFGATSHEQVEENIGSIGWRLTHE